MLVDEGNLLVELYSAHGIHGHARGAPDFGIYTYAGHGPSPRGSAGPCHWDMWENPAGGSLSHGMGAGAHLIPRSGGWSP